MLTSAGLVDQQYQSVVSTLTSVKTFPQELQSKSKHIAPVPHLAPVILEPHHQPINISKRKKPATVREMLRTKKLERQRQLQRQQIVQRQQQQERLQQGQSQQQQQTRQNQRHQPAYQVFHHMPGTMGKFGVNKSKLGQSSLGKSARVASGKKKGRPLMPKSSISDDKKEIHRLNERHRHQNMNQSIRQLVSMLPKNPGPEAETKQFVLQKAGDYISYLKEKIEGACDDMDVARDNSEGGLMSFDIPFENNTGLRHIRVPRSKPITPSDLHDLLAPTSALRLNDLPQRKLIPKTERKLKPAKQTHQPWLEINIKMNMNEYKSMCSGRGQKNRGSGTKKKSTQKATRGEQAMKHGDLMTDWADIGEKPRSNLKQERLDTYRSASSQSSDVQSSMMSQSSNHSWKRLSNYCALDEEQDNVQVDSDADDDDVDLTCVDVLSDEEDEGAITVKIENEHPTKSSIDFGSDKKVSPPSQQVPSWIRYGSSSSPLAQDQDSKLRLGSSNSPSVSGRDPKLRLGSSNSPSLQCQDSKLHNYRSPSSPSSQGQDLKLRCGSSNYQLPQGQDSKHQMDHSYSARELSPRTLQALAQFEEFGDPLDDDKGHTASQTIGMEMIDDVLKAVVLEAPPDECVPPQSPSTNSKVYVIQAYGLDFDDDSDVAQGSLFPRNTSPSISPGMQEACGIIPDNHDSFATSFGSGKSEPSVMRRSWINGYQLFTKINHPRVKRFWPGLHSREVTRLLGNSWKDLSDESKRLYSVRACEWNQWYREIRSQKKTED